MPPATPTTTRRPFRSIERNVTPTGSVCKGHDAARDDEDAPAGRADLRVEPTAAAGVERHRPDAQPERAAQLGRPRARRWPDGARAFEDGAEPDARAVEERHRRAGAPGQLVAELGGEERAILFEAHADLRRERQPPEVRIGDEPRLDGRAVGGFELCVAPRRRRHLQDDRGAELATFDE